MTECGKPASGQYDLQFALFPSAESIFPLSDFLTNSAVIVSDGFFTTALDFGTDVFSSPELWLQTAVRSNGVSDFTVQSPRQRVNPTPWAICASVAKLAVLASNVAPGSVTSTALASGSVHAFHLYPGAVGPDQLAVQAITGAHIGKGVIQEDHLGPHTVCGPHLAPGAVTDSCIAPGSVNSCHLCLEAVQGEHIAVGTIQGDRIAQGVILSNHIAWGAIHPAHLAANTFVTNDYAGTIRAAAFAGDGSLLTGIVAVSTNAGFTNYIVCAPATGVAATDTANLQYALDRSTNNGVNGWGGNTEIFIPAGDFRLNDSLVLRMHGTRLRGAGQLRTRLWMTANNKDAIIWNGLHGLNYGGTNAAWFISIEDLTLQKPVASWTAGMSAGINWTAPSVGMQNLSRGYFKNLFIAGFFYGMRFNHTVGVLAQNVEAYGNNHGFYLEKVDAAVFLNCFAGDGYDLTTGGNRFGTDYSTGWTYKTGGVTGDTRGFSLAILGGEGRGCNTLFDIQCGLFSLQNFNLERMYAGPPIQLGTGIMGARIQNVNFMGRYATNLQPNIRFEAGAGQRTVVDTCCFADSSAAPHLELNSTTDFVHYRGPVVSVTNRATGQACNLHPAPIFTNIPSAGHIAYATGGSTAKWDAPPIGVGLSDVTNASLAVIQSLEQRVEGEVAQLRADNAQLNERLAQLEVIVEQLAKDGANNP